MRPSWTEIMLSVALGTWVLLAGCARTMIGIPTPPPAEMRSEPLPVRLCATLDDGVSEERARDLIDGWNRQYTDALGVRFVVVEIRHEPRPANLLTAGGWTPPPLEPPCDRQMYFAARSVGDVALGAVTLMMPIRQYFGWTDGETGTYSAVLVEWAAPYQVALLMTPALTVEHELFHLLGCQHATFRADCWSRIAELKALAVTNEHDFFPAMTPERGRLRMHDRQAVNWRRARFAK